MKSESIGHLTKKQKRIISELEEIRSLLKMSYENILKEDRDARTPILELIKRNYIISAIVDRYTLADEFFNMIICNYFFPKKGFMYLWRTKKFKNFNYYVLERLYLLQKFDLFKGIHRIKPALKRDIESYITNLNDIRNSVAHSFFPENRRKKPEYRGKDIFSIEGLKLFLEDGDNFYDYVVNRFII